MVEHSSDSAINRILAAEQQARSAVDECHKASDATINQALARARAIAHRTDQRIALVHTLADRHLEQAEALLATERAALEQAPPLDPVDLEHLPQAIDALISEMLGAAP